MAKKSKSIFLKKSRVTWTRDSWRLLPPSPTSEDDKAEIKCQTPKDFKKSSHTCIAGKERGERVRKSWGRGGRIIKQDLSKNKFYGE